MKLPKILNTGGVTKSHLEEVKADAERITLRRIREQMEEAEYKAEKAERKAAQKAKKTKAKKSKD